MIQREPISSQSEPTAAELEALLAAPLQPTIRPRPKVQPRTKRVRADQTDEDNYYFDVNDGTIKAEPVPEAPVTRTEPVIYRAPARDWD
jgi:hypothetical protein